jgi:nitroreductase/dihydropteridine reductase
MQNNVFLRLAQERYTTKHYNGQQIPLEGVDFPKLNEILGLDEKNLTAIAAVSLGYRSPKDGNAQRPKSRLTRDELFTSLD